MKPNTYRHVVVVVAVAVVVVAVVVVAVNDVSYKFFSKSLDYYNKSTKML